MNDKIYAGMAEATRLTRAGRLAEATALIRRQLGRTPVQPSSPTDLVSAPGPIEATFRVSDEPKPVPGLPNAEVPSEKPPVPLVPKAPPRELPKP